MKTRSFLPAGLLATASLVLSAQAVPGRPADVDQAELEAFATTDQLQAASKKVQDVASAPADVVVLRGGDLKSLGYRTLGDALGGVLGFRTNQDHAYQGMASDGIYALGDQNTRILVLLDGHALNSPAEVGSSKVGEDFGLPMELVDHIEIVRGPASTMYGNNAFQAVINVVSAAASGDCQGFIGGVTAGTDRLAELWAQQTVTFGGVTSSLMLSGYRRNGTAQLYPELQPQALPADADGEQRQSAYLFVKGDQWTFASAMLSRTQGLASAPYGGIPGSSLNSYRNLRTSGEFKWEPVTGNVHWMMRLFGDQNEFEDSLTSLGGGLGRDADPDRSLGVELQGRAVVSRTFSVTFGSEQQRHRYNGLYTAPGIAVNTDVSYSVGNTYLEGNWQPSSAFQVVAGLQRAAWRPYDAVNTLNGLALSTQGTDITRLTPRLSLIWKPGPADVVKVIYGQGFRFPTIFEEYYTDGQTQFANPALKPEVVTSQELTWSRKWSSAFSSQGALILIRGEHTIVPAANAVGAEQYVNVPDATQGRIAQLELAWHRSGLQLSGGAGYYDMTYNGGMLQNSSRWLAVFKAIQQAGAWSVAAEARFVDARTNPLTPTGTPAWVPANWTLRASLRRDWNWGWAQASVEDLTNSRRRDLVAPEYAPVTWMEGDGRTARVSVGFRR